MPYVANVEVANFHLTFGRQELIDQLDTIVLRAFLKGTRQQFREQVKWRWLHQVTFEELSSVQGKTPAIIGRFVKHIVYRSHQKEVDDVLKPDNQSLPTDPSSIFVLMLDTHRLLYLREFSESPKIDEFKNAMQSFLSLAHREFLREEKERLKAGGEKVTLEDLEKRIPSPELEVIPLANAIKSAELVQKLEIVKKLTIRLVKTNSEGISGELMADSAKFKGSLGARDFKIEASSPVEGLNKTTTSRVIRELADQGTADYEAIGDMKDGSYTRIVNETTAAKKPMPHVSKDVSAASHEMMGGFFALISDGSIPAPATPVRVAKILRDSIRNLYEVARSYMDL